MKTLLVKGFTKTIFFLVSLLLEECPTINALWPARVEKLSFNELRGKESFDFIVVGAGASGAAVAARLSENKKITVLLLEAGGFPLYLTDVPYFATGPLGGVLDWNFKTERQNNSFLQYVDQKTDYPRGKGLGGSTLINGMVATRGNKRDYDMWKEMGNEGWGYEELLPYFQKLESYKAPLIQNEDENYHGFHGPVNIDRAPYTTELNKAFQKAVQESGYRIIDYNAEIETGTQDPVFTINNGRRWSTFSAYIQPAMKRENFYLAIHANVVKILFEGKKAVGVVYENNGKERTVYSTMEVILSAGAVQSPQLLMVSGVGPQETLSHYNISVVANRPGVGKNFQDHICVLGVAFTAEKTDIGIDPVNDMTANTMEEWETKGEGPLTVATRLQGVAFLNTKFANKNIDFPDYEIFMFQPPGFTLGLKKELIRTVLESKENVPVIYTLTILLRPKSIGYVSIRSSNALDDPVIQPNYLSNPEDVEILVDAIKTTYSIMNQSSMAELGVKPLGTVLPGCENFTQYSDDYFRCQIRSYPSILFHAVGTCKMGPKNDSMAVVDNRLRAYGIKNLRIVDASVFPTIISAHPMIPAIMVAEKAAVMIAEDNKFEIN